MSLDREGLDPVVFEHTVKQEEERLRVLHPTVEDIPKCMTLFDDFISCHVTKNQIKSLYRYGQRSDCSYKLADWKFCMSAKFMHPEEKRDAWIRRRAEWWATRRLTRSSEDVWDIRTEPLKEYPPQWKALAPSDEAKSDLLS